MLQVEKFMRNRNLMSFRSRRWERHVLDTSRLAVWGEVVSVSSIKQEGQAKRSDSKSSITALGKVESQWPKHFSPSPTCLQCYIVN